ncbi:hypothetical protein JQ594_11905 [Bradyrhizobium manausense]|uniref:hypothetical protein n=1 Tax=Bradyrhizobium manausense TaxID=989370 RepID=UPI001BAB056B|nr:hypothetical protein [Bradyrhizobium manausense]MBR0686623.1 hypothetical protein [Bradyrhizobium manausense]
MLPGLRFLLAAILLSTSILVFGLGAASLLRASHEQYVSNPSWRNGPQEQVFAQAPEPAQPVLAALRVEPAADEVVPAMQDQIPSIALPAVEIGPEQMAAVTLKADVQPAPQIVAAAPAAEAAAEPPAPEPASVQVAASAPTDTLTPADTTVAIATATPAPAATEVPRTATPALASRVSDIAAARVAALNDLAPAKTKANGATPDGKPRAHKKKRHRIVRRPPPQQLQQSYDPFGQQQQQTLATTATRTR